MRVLHIVTYVSSDGAFGGPMRVAFGQAEAVARRGHEVTLVAGAPVPEPQEYVQAGYTVRLFPSRRLGRGRGFASLISPRMTWHLLRSMARCDVAHIHLARDLVTIPASVAIRMRRIPYVVQPHGMIDPSDKLLARVLDFAATRPSLRRASDVLVLTDREQAEIAKVEPRAATRSVPNGIRRTATRRIGKQGNTVLFLARLHPRKRPRAFVEMAGVLRETLPDAQFIVAGPDEGEAVDVARLIESLSLGDRVSCIGPVRPSDTDRLLREARVFVLPSVDEVFPMTILEAFNVGTPVVTTDSLGLADLCNEYGAAIVTDGSVEGLASAVQEVVQDESVADRLCAGADRLLRERLSIDAVAELLEQRYRVAASQKAVR